jgi:hypothetical protein
MDGGATDAHPWDQMNPAVPKFEKYPNRPGNILCPNSKPFRGMETRKVVSPKRVDCRPQETSRPGKEIISKQRDQSNLLRRKLPWVKIEKESVLEGRPG